MKLNLILLTLVSFISFNTYAQEIQNFQDDNAYLDSAYTHLIHPKISPVGNKALASKSDFQEAMNFQTPVRSQESRGTCSIFSATAYVESLMLQNEFFNQDLNLSEEWLQYTSVRGRQSDGSSAPSNFEAVKKYGMAMEETLPYIGQDWTKAESTLTQKRCAGLTGTTLKSCQITHFDPTLLLKKDSEIADATFIKARTEALNFKKEYLTTTNSNYYLYDTAAIKQRLLDGKPVVLELDFYYGAWNHRGGEELGIVRNMDLWSKGVIGNPEPGSLDLAKSPTKPAGHSVLVVGYDDNKVVKISTQMADGTTKTFTYKGVYYIKNSWGTSSFGSNFQVDGVNYPGYGMITQKHANNDGSFFAL